MPKDSKKTILYSKLQKGHRGPSAAAPQIAVTKEPVSVLPPPPLPKKSDGTA